jgi:hypothetical protein
MIKYIESQNRSDGLVLREAVLELPDGRNFAPKMNRRAPADFLDVCASYLPKLRQRGDYRQRRLENGCPIEFDLEHPERVPASYPVDLLDELLKGL